MQANISQALTREECAGWQLYAGRSERLHDHVEMLREYLLQLRELYQSQIEVQQNRVMSILTVVTTIFLPLTLIAGWYGMNFPGMPEFGWKYGYPTVILISILIIVLRFSISRRKRCCKRPVGKLTGRRLPGIMNGSAAMAELADAQDLGSCIERCVGSSPLAA